MHKLIKLMLLSSTIGISTVALADWETAYNKGEKDTGDYRYKRCFYETMGGLKFSIIIQDLFCPMYIQYNPETGKWRKD